MDSDDFRQGEEIIKEEDIDWNSLLEPFNDFSSLLIPGLSMTSSLYNITSSLDHGAQGGNRDNTILGKQKNRISFSQRVNDDGAVETDESKIKRTGSLNRILIASRSMSVATNDASIPFDDAMAAISLPPVPPEKSLIKPSLSKAAPLPSRIIAAENKFKVPTNPNDVVLKMIHTFNAGDVEALSNIVRHSFSNECVYCSDIMDNVPLKGKTDIMMYLALQLELYPDGVWIPGNNVSSLAQAETHKKEGSIIKEFTFSGTRVFKKMTKELFHHIKQEENMHDRSAVEGASAACMVQSSVQNPSYNVEKLGKLLETAYIADSSPPGNSVASSDSCASNRVSDSGSISSSTKSTSTLTTTNIAALNIPIGIDNHYRKLVFHFNDLNFIVKVEAAGDL